MEPNKPKLEPEPVELTDLPPQDKVDASHTADKVKGGAEIVSPRDAASGLPTGKRM